MLSKMSSILQPKNAVFLYDRKTRCRDVACVEGMLVQDVINQACHNLDPPIAPIGQFFFGLKDMKTHCYLSPYHPIPPGNHRYQLRVFVSPAQSNFQFQTVSRSLLNYYYQQLKEDFIHDWLYPPVSVNNAIWMVAADMAKEAIEKKREFNDFSQPEIMRLSSPSLKDKWKEDPSVGEMLETTFHKFREAYDKFHTSGSSKEGEHFPDHFHCRYLEIYEQDDHCSTHLFQLKQQPSHFSQTTFHRKSRDSVVILAISPKKGLYRFKFKGKKQADNMHLCRVADISAVVLDDQALTATVECAGRSGLEPHPPPQTHRLHFKSKEDLMSFFAVLDAYYRLKVDANSTVLKVNKDREMEEGSLSPTPKFDGLPNADLYYAPICHEAVRNIFKKFDYPEGHFLIRQSRSHESSFVLSLCRSQKVLNFRIIKHQDGSLSLCNPRQGEGDQSTEPTFDSLHDLIESHKSRRSGLPILLTHIYSPNVTGPIPLVPGEREDDSETVSLVSTSPSIPSLPAELPAHIKELTQDGVPYIDYEHIKIEAELGSGHFSTVYRGMWDNMKVAVKVPSGLSTTTADLVMKDLTNEIKVMAKLDHHNIIKLHGITNTPHFLDCLKTVTMVVMEFVEEGSLSSYLERIRRNPVPQTPDAILRDKRLTFLNFSWQIADAMEYLEGRGLVHRDLATRNVLVVSNAQIKVSDFGLARQFKDDKDYYPASNNKDVPIFWFAPECLLPPHKFTNKSDVWSFGVTLWELFSLGDNPKHFLNPQLSKCKTSADAFPTLVEFYKNPANRLPQRNHFPSEVYALLRQCWAFYPADRPAFTGIKDQISTLY